MEAVNQMTILDAVQLANRYKETDAYKQYTKKYGSDDNMDNVFFNIAFWAFTEGYEMAGGAILPADLPYPDKSTITIR